MTYQRKRNSFIRIPSPVETTPSGLEEEEREAQDIRESGSHISLDYRGRNTDEGFNAQVSQEEIDRRVEETLLKNRLLLMSSEQDLRNAVEAAQRRL